MAEWHLVAASDPSGLDKCICQVETFDAKNDDPEDVRMHQFYIEAVQDNAEDPEIDAKYKQRFIEAKDFFPNDKEKRPHARFAHYPACIMVQRKGSYQLSRTQREVLLLGGRAGSGKSYYAGCYIRRFLAIYASSICYIFMADDKSKSYDSILEDFPTRVKRVMVNEVKNIEPFKFQECLVVFDDFDHYGDKTTQNKVDEIITNIVEYGRDKQVFCILIAHLFLQYHRSRSYLAEYTSLTVFPRDNQRKQIYEMFKRLDIPKEEVNTMMFGTAAPDPTSRWVTYFPDLKCVLTERTCFLRSPT